MARSFNATSDKIEVSYAPTSSDHSIVVLLKPGSTGLARQILTSTVGSLGDPVSGTHARDLYVEAAGQFSYYTFLSPLLTSTEIAVSGAPLLVGASFKNSDPHGGKIFINGRLSQVKDTSTAYASLTRQIIGPPAGVFSWFNGEIEWIGWWATALTDAQQRAIATGTDPATLSPAWLLVLGAGTPADSSGNGVTITTTGTTPTTAFSIPTAATLRETQLVIEVVFAPDPNSFINHSDAISIAESARVSLTPLVVRANDAITATDSVRAPVASARHETCAVVEAVHVVLTPLVVRASDSLTITESAFALVARLLTESITITESVAAQLVAYLRLAVSDSLTISEFRSLVLRTFSQIQLFEFFTIAEHVVRRVPAGGELAPKEFVHVVDVAKAQLLIGGGLFARVADAVTITENPFYIGYRPVIGGAGEGDPDTVGVGPHVPAPSSVGDDYWEVGA